MEKYAVLDWIAGDVWDEYFDSKEEALQKAEDDWNALSDYDKKRRDFFGVIYGEYDEEIGFTNDYDVIFAYKDED